MNSQTIIPACTTWRRKPTSSGKNSATPVYPIGLDYLAGMVSLRYEVKIIDLLEKHSTERLAGIVGDFGPRLSGLPIRNIDNMDAFETETYVNGYQQLISAIREM